MQIGGNKDEKKKSEHKPGNMSKPEKIIKN